MKKQYYKVIDEKGRISIPIEMRKNADMECSDVVQLFQFGNLIILERVSISETNTSEKLCTLLQKNMLPTEAIQCYIISALSTLSCSQLCSIIDTAKQFLK